MVVGQDEGAGAIGAPLIDADGERALAFRQDGRKVSGVGLDQLILADGFVRDEVFPDDRTNDLGNVAGRIRS